MKKQTNNTVQAARERMTSDRNGRMNMADFQSGDLRSKIIEFFGTILWISLAIGIITTLWQLITLQILTAVMTFITTVVTVGAGFVVLDIRERLISGS